MTAIVLALLMGVIAGLRTMTAPAAVSWAASLGRLGALPAVLAFVGYPPTRWIASALALAELVVDQLPSTPSRTLPVPFGARLVSGALCGGCIGAGRGTIVAGLIAGLVGAVIGTLGGHTVRMRLAARFGSDRPAALIEDVIALAGAFIIVLA
jgi:uncharacterized membrane protein